MEQTHTQETIEKVEARYQVLKQKNESELFARASFLFPLICLEGAYINELIGYILRGEFGDREWYKWLAVNNNK